MLYLVMPSRESEVFWCVQNRWIVMPCSSLLFFFLIFISILRKLWKLVKMALAACLGSPTLSVVEGHWSAGATHWSSRQLCRWNRSLDNTHLLPGQEFCSASLVLYILDIIPYSSFFFFFGFSTICCKLLNLESMRFCRFNENHI